jgi:hypothetical protein
MNQVDSQEINTLSCAICIEDFNKDEERYTPAIDTRQDSEVDEEKLPCYKSEMNEIIKIKKREILFHFSLGLYILISSTINLIFPTLSYMLLLNPAILTFLLLLPAPYFCREISNFIYPDIQKPMKPPVTKVNTSCVLHGDCLLNFIKDKQQKSEYEYTSVTEAKKKTEAYYLFIKMNENCTIINPVKINNKSIIGILEK